MISIAITWFIVGLGAGLGIGAVWTAHFGDSELNQQVRSLRKNRRDLAILQFEIKLRKFLHKNPNMNLVVTTAPKDEKQL